MQQDLAAASLLKLTSVTETDVCVRSTVYSVCWHAAIVGGSHVPMLEEALKHLTLLLDLVTIKLFLLTVGS